MKIKRILSLALICVTLLTMFFAATPAQAASYDTQSLDGVVNTAVTIKHKKSGLFLNLPYGKYSQSPKLILWPADNSDEQVLYPKTYSNGSMRLLFNENHKYCVDIYRGSSKSIKSGQQADSWKVTSSEDMCQLFVPYIVPGQDDVVIFRMKSNPKLALGAKKTAKNTILELMTFNETDSRLFFQFCNRKYKVIDLAVQEPQVSTGLLKPVAGGIKAKLSASSIKYSESVSISVTLDATALADTVTVKIGSVSKSVTPSIAGNKIGQTAKVSFEGSELGTATNHQVTVTATNGAGSTSINVGSVKVSMSFVQPLKAINGGKTNIVTQGFGSNGYDPTRDHLGVDYGGKASYVVAICDGTVVDIYTGNGYGYGNTVVLKHEYNNVVFYTLYGHMRDRSVKVEKGDTVSAGQILGTMGSTGTSTGDHVHVSVFTGSYKVGSTIPAGYYSGLFSGTSVKYKGFKFYDARQLIKTEGAILTS